MISAFLQKTSTSFKIFLLAAVVIFIYSFSIGGDFKTDDRFSILLNPLIRDFSHVLDFFKQGYFGDQSYYRPFVYLTYAVEHYLFGGNSFFYNLDNVLIHIINALLVWKLADRLMPESRPGFWVALLFAVHPIHWEAVANISGRSILLCTMFSLASFYAFIRAFEKERALWLAASTACFALALLNKESAGVLPGILFFYVVTLRGGKIPWKKLGLYLLPFAAIIIGYIVLRKILGLDAVHLWPTLQERILGFVSFLRSLVTHLRMLVWPVGLYFDRSQAVYPSLEHPEVLYVGTLWMLVAVELWVLRRYFKPVDRLCLAWFLLELFPVSQVIAAVGVSPGYIAAADHFLYGASVPFFILTIRLIGGLMSAPFVRMYVRPIRLTLAAFFVFLVVINIQQNLYARDEQTMLDRSLAYQPHNSRLQNLAGYLAVQYKNYRLAEEHFRIAADIDPLNASPQISLGKVLCDQGRIGECLTQYLSVADPGPFASILESNIAYPAGILQERIASGRKLSQAEWFAWGLHQARNGHLDDAITAMENLLAVNPENLSGLMMSASFYEVAGDIGKSRDCYFRLMSIHGAPEEVLDYAIARLADLRINHPEAF